MNKLLTNFPVTLTEEQKNVLKLTLSAVLQDDPVTKYWRPTVYENGDIMWDLAASETKPSSQNIKGPSGFTPHFQIDQSTAEWQVTYDGTNWTPLGIIASGAQGPQGISGKDGADGTDGKDGTNGTSVYLDNVSTVAGGTQVTLGWGTSDTSAFVIPSGAAGAPGTNGISPTVELSEIQDPDYPQGGWNVKITDAEHQSGQTFQIFNGIDGQGAAVDLVEGTGIQITHQAGTTDYTIGVSADYALKSYANEASANALSAAETWVNQQNFATSAGLDANKQFAMTTSGWKEVQGGGSTYTPGDCIDITNDVISFDGLNVDTAYSGTLPKLAGDGTTEHPLSMSSFSEAVETVLDEHDTAIADLAAQLASIGATISLKGSGTVSYLNNLQQAEVNTGDAYIVTTDGTVWGKGSSENISVLAGDLIVYVPDGQYGALKPAALSTAPDLSIYSKLTQRSIIEAGQGTTVSHATNADGAVVYTVNAIPGGEGTTNTYTVSSNDDRYTFTKTANLETGEIKYTMSSNLAKFHNVASMEGITAEPNSYYFVIE